MRLPHGTAPATSLRWEGRQAHLPAPRGSAILAPAGGVVRAAFFDREHGHLVRIEHADKALSVFTHLDAPAPLAVGQAVSEGDTVGVVGSDGVHGYAVTWHAINPAGRYTDPRDWLFGTNKGRLVAAFALSAMLLGMALAWPDATITRGGPRS